MTPVVEADLREVFLGEWEGGLLRMKSADGDPVFAQVLAEQRWDVIPGAESREVFGGRLRRAVERITAAHPGGRVVVFSHGAAIGEMLAQATGSEPFAFVGPDNASHLASGGDARPLDHPWLQRHVTPGGLNVNGRTHRHRPRGFQRAVGSQ